MKWTTEQDDQIKVWWTDGWSAAQIADKMGCCSRSAILGRINRKREAWGLGPRRRIVKYRPRKPRARKLNVVQFRDVSPTPPTTEHNRLIWNLTNQTCRYPLWNDDTPIGEKFYCGAPGADCSDGRPYCGWHNLIATRQTRSVAA